MELVKSKVGSRYQLFDVILETKGLSDKDLEETLSDAAIEILENSSRIYFVHFDEKYPLKRTGEILFKILHAMNGALTKENAAQDQRLGDHYTFTNKQATTSIMMTPVSFGIDARFFLPQIKDKHSYEYSTVDIKRNKFEIYNLDEQRELEQMFYGFYEFEFDPSIDKLMPSNQLQGILSHYREPGFYSEICPKSNLMFGKSYYGFEKINRESKGEPRTIPYIDEYQSRTVTFHAPDLVNLRDHWETPKELLK